jgi:hypothetical protein
VSRVTMMFVTSGRKQVHVRCSCSAYGAPIVVYQLQEACTRCIPREPCRVLSIQLEFTDAMVEVTC